MADLIFFGQIGDKDYIFINDLSGDSNTFSHCKSCQYSSDSKTFDMTEKEACHTGSCKQTDDVKRNLNDWIFLLYDLRQLAWKKVGRNDWQTATVGKRDTDTDQHITNYKIKNPVSDNGWKNVDPQFMDIKQFSEEKTNDKTAQILRDKFLP